MAGIVVVGVSLIVYLSSFVWCAVCSLYTESVLRSHIVTNYYSVQCLKSGLEIPNKSGWPGSPPPGSNPINANTTVAV